MAKYAANTSVASDRSRAEIERTLQRYGAKAFGYSWSGDDAMVMFEIVGRRVKYSIRMPSRKSPEFLLTPGRRYERTPDAALAAWEQACRQRWRALSLVIKAKLEAVDAGISTVEEEFLAHVMTPDGSTVHEWLAPQLERAYATGQMPALMPGASRG